MSLQFVGHVVFFICALFLYLFLRFAAAFEAMHNNQHQSTTKNKEQPQSSTSHAIIKQIQQSKT
jgi:hypothetical protein